MSPGREEQIAAERAALVNVDRMGEPLVVIAWKNETAVSHLGWCRAFIASRPVTVLALFGLGAFVYGFVVGMGVH